MADLPIRLRQCKACPWKVSTVPDRDIPGGYCSTKHAGLRRTIAELNDVDDPGVLRVMACHETSEGRDLACTGWIAHELGPGNNIALRWRVRGQKGLGLVLDGEQHKTFEDTLLVRRLMSRQTEWRKRKRVLGLCGSCGAPDDGGSLCSACRQKDRARVHGQVRAYAANRAARRAMMALQCFKRRCGVCRCLGHNRRTCPQVFPSPVENSGLLPL